MAFLLSPSLFVVFLFDQIGISSSIGSIIILLNILLLAHRSLHSFRLLKFQRNIILVYIFIVIYVSLLWILIYSGQRSGTPKGIIRNTLFVIAFFIILNSSNFNLPKFTNYLIILSFIFSIFSIILFIGFYLDYITPVKYIPPGYSAYNPHFHAFGGFIGEYFHFETGISIRNQSYWTEPAKFAQYLQIPLFLSFYKLRLDKSFKNIFIFVTIFVAFILTFSVANTFSLFISITILNFYRIISYKRVLFNIILLGISIFLLFQFYDITNVESTRYIVAKETDEGFENRYERFSIIYNYITETPFGDKTKASSTGNPTALGNVFIDGGFPLVFLVFVIMFFFLKQYFLHIKRSNYKLIFISFISFFIAFNWYGGYFNLYFLFIICLFSTYIRYEKLNKRFI